MSGILQGFSQHVRASVSPTTHPARRQLLTIFEEGFSNATVQLYCFVGDDCVNIPKTFSCWGLRSMSQRAVLLILLSAGVARAAETVTQPFSTPPVQNFTVNNISNISSVLSECSGQSFADSLGALSACSMGSGQYNSDLDLSCSFLTPQTALAEGLKIDLAISGLQCKKGQMAQARGKIDCLSRGASLLQSMIGQQRSQFEKEIQAAQSALRQLEQIKKGFEQQDETIGKRLKGDDESSAGGLIQAEKEMESILAEMQGPQGSVESFKKNSRALQDQKKFLLEQVQARTLEVTTQCVREGGTDGKRYQCAPNTPDVDYLNYLGCLYGASFQVGENGQIEKDEVNKKRAASNVQSLGRALDSMLQAIPRSIGSPPSSGPQLDRFSSGTDLWFTFNDFKEGIRTRLSRFENKNFRIADRIVKKAESCFNSAKLQVAKERKGSAGAGLSGGGQQASGGSRLVDLQNKVKDTEEAQNAQAKKFFTDASKAYSSAIRPLIGRNVNLPIEQCVSAKSSVQGSCMDKIVTNFEDIYLGRSELSKLNMVVPGNGAVKDLVIQCAGLKGCVTDLQAQHNYLQSTVKQVKQVKQKYAAETNQKIDAMRTSLAKAMAFPNQLVIQQQEELNKFLAGLGVSGAVELEDVEGKAFEKDDAEAMDGLYKNPVGEDFLAAIGAGATPPLKKLGKGSFKDAYKGISEAVKETDKEVGKLNSLKGKIQAAQAKCLEQEKEKILSSMERSASDISECSRYMDPKSRERSQLEGLYSSLQSVSGVDSSGIDSSLQDGMGSFGSDFGAAGDSLFGSESRNCKSKFSRALNVMKAKLGSLQRVAGAGGFSNSAR
jgi:hypothetical protein